MLYICEFGILPNLEQWSLFVVSDVTSSCKYVGSMYKCVNVMSVGRPWCVRLCVQYCFFWSIFHFEDCYHDAIVWWSLHGVEEEVRTDMWDFSFINKEI